jgi:hypothetical protein
VSNTAVSQHSLSLSSKSRKCVYWYSERSSLKDGFAVHVHIIAAFICVRTGKEKNMV